MEQYMEHNDHQGQKLGINYGDHYAPYIAPWLLKSLHIFQ
jgi:hypothetical protein